MDLEIHVCRVCKDLSYGLISLFHCFTSGLRLLQWVSDVDVRVPLAEQRRGDAINEQLPSDEAHTDQPQSVHSYLCWLHAVFVGSLLFFLAPGCLSWLLSVFLGSLSFSRSFSSLSFFQPLYSFILFFSSVLFVLFTQITAKFVCVCVCEGGRERERDSVDVCVCVCLQASCEKI